MMINKRRTSYTQWHSEFRHTPVATHCKCRIQIPNKQDLYACTHSSEGQQDLRVTCTRAGLRVRMNTHTVCCHAIWKLWQKDSGT